jgi:RHS repeat-associated protein
LKNRNRRRKAKAAPIEILNCAFITSYERDNETDLDFAQARMYTNRLGRFQSPDPLYFTAERPTDPQQFNLYVYVRNNPLRYIDPDGEDYVGTDGNKVEVECLRDEKGKIIGIKSVGENATANLKRIVALIDKFKSKEALKDFIKGDESATRINISFVKSGNSRMEAEESADGVPEYIKDPKTGKMIYKEITLVINDSSVDDLKGLPGLRSFREQLEEKYNVSNLTQEEYVLGLFGHELHHGLDKKYIKANRKVYLNKKLSEKERESKLYENYQKDEPKAQDRVRKILQEIKKL